MGTEYILYEDDSFGKLTIDEMSNKFTLDFDPGQLFHISTSDQMTPEELAKTLLTGLTVCSYWMDTDELKALIQDHMDKEIY